jgi:hypothetical protein
MRYRVIGNHAIRGRRPGETIVMSVDEAARYVEAGHLAPDKTTVVQADEKDTTPEKGDE